MVSDDESVGQVKAELCRQRKQAVREAILRAFSGVELGNGLGLREAFSLDDYSEDEKVQREARELDEKRNWLAIRLEDVNGLNAFMYYLDAEGMRFHLPAVMLFTLEGDTIETECVLDVASHLAARHGKGFCQFSLLNAEQKEVVREFLLYMRDCVDETSPADRVDIDRALSEYWTARAD